MYMHDLRPVAEAAAALLLLRAEGIGDRARVQATGRHLAAVLPQLAVVVEAEGVSQASDVGRDRVVPA